MSEESRLVDTEQMDGFCRRRILKGLGATTMAGLAGCSGDDSDTDNAGRNNETTSGSDTTLGERVPEPITYMYFTGLGNTTSNYETIATAVLDNITETFGLEADTDGRDVATGIVDVSNDTRDFHMWPITPSTNPLQVDADAQRLGTWNIVNAGANKRQNFANYASCNASKQIESQRTASDSEARAEILRNALSTISKDIGNIPVGENLIKSASRSDTIEIKRADNKAGLTDSSPYPLIYSEALDGNSITVSAPPNLFERLNYHMFNQFNVLMYWGFLIHSPLFELDGNYELQNSLANTLEVSENSRRITIELADAKFHNGNQVTSEDVKWTFQHISNKSDVYGEPDNIPYKSITLIDDKTAEFTFADPRPTWIKTTATKWGILNKESWVKGGAEKNPEQFTFVPGNGSGPFKIDEFKKNQRMILSPADQEHPIHNPDHPLRLVKYSNKTTAAQALINGEVDILPNINSGSAKTIKNGLGERVNMHYTTGLWPHSLLPQHTVPPMTEREFRAALGACINRALINELLNNSKTGTELYSTIVSSAHPQRPSNDSLTKLADNPKGEPDRARQILKDAGWGWDDNGNLRYPADADISPPWPKGETPSSKYGFPCLTDDGNFTNDY